MPANGMNSGIPFEVWRSQIDTGRLRPGPGLVFSCAKDLFVATGTTFAWMSSSELTSGDWNHAGPEQHVGIQTLRHT